MGLSSKSRHHRNEALLHPHGRSAASLHLLNVLPYDATPKQSAALVMRLIVAIFPAER